MMSLAFDSPEDTRVSRHTGHSLSVGELTAVEPLPVTVDAELGSGPNLQTAGSLTQPAAERQHWSAAAAGLLSMTFCRFGTLRPSASIAASHAFIVSNCIAA